MLTLRTRLKYVAARRERQLDTVRALIRYCWMLSELVLQQDASMHEREYLFDAIADGESLLKELGGCAIR